VQPQPTGAASQSRQSGQPTADVVHRTLTLLLKIQGEEKMMLEQFGHEYPKYIKRTGRLLPVW